jgi:hypothetical protein
MAIRYTLGFAETGFTIDGAAALHIVCTAAEAASAGSATSFDVTLRSTNGLHSVSFPGVLLPDGQSAVSIPYVVPLDWADDFTQLLGDLAQPEACGLFSASMTAHYTLTAGTARFSADYTGYAALLAAGVRADLLPTVGAVTAAQADAAVPAAWGIWVQGLSQVRLTAAAAAGCRGSAIAGYTFGAAGTPQSENSAVLALDKSGSVTIPVTVTDTRGRTATQDLLLQVEAYAAPVLSGVSSRRCTADGTPAEEGACFSAEAALTGADLGGKNPIAVTCAWKKVTEADYGAAVVLTPGAAQVIDAALESGASYDVRYRASDAFHTIDTYDYVSSTVYLLHFRKGGTGLAVGKAAEADNLFDVALPAQFRRDAAFGGALAVAGALTLGGADVGAALADIGTLRTGACTPDGTSLTAVSENRAVRCGRVALCRLHGTLTNGENPPYEGERYRVAALPADFYSADWPPLALAFQNGKPCKAEADAAGNLYVIPAADGQTDTEVYTVGIV